MCINNVGVRAVHDVHSTLSKNECTNTEGHMKRSILRPSDILHPNFFYEKKRTKKNSNEISTSSLQFTVCRRTGYDAKQINNFRKAPAN